MRIPLFSMLLLCATAIFAAPDVSVVPVPQGGAVPDAEVDAAGAIHLAFVVGENVFYAKSSDDGASFSEPVRVNSEPDSAHPANMYRGPDLALGKDGRAHVIWYSNGYQRKLPKEQWGVQYSHLNGAGTAFIPARNLNHKPSDNYSLAVDGSGRVAVFWMADGLFLHESKDGGETFAAAKKISISDPCECCASRASFSADGALLCLYRDKADNERDMFLITEPKGAAEFTRAKLSSVPWQVKACPMTGGFIAPGKNGAVAAWETKGQVYFARCDARGQKISAAEIAAGTRGGKWPIALAAPDGSTLVTWKRGTNVEWQMFDASDKAIGTVQSAPGSNPHRHAAVVTKSGGFRIFN